MGFCVLWALGATASKHIEINDVNTSETSNRTFTANNTFAAYISTGSEWKFIHSAAGRAL